MAGNDLDTFDEPATGEKSWSRTRLAGRARGYRLRIRHREAGGTNFRHWDLQQSGTIRWNFSQVSLKWDL
jgi:hypothetical protein